MSNDIHAARDAITSGRHYFVATDGACPGNPGVGGWGVLLQLREGDQVLRQAAFADREGSVTTNIRMEMMAVLSGLMHLTKEPTIPALILSDNEMIVNSMTLGWFEKWKAAGWWNGKKPRTNADLWEKIDAALGARVVHWQWVRGHAGHPLNEIADMLASNAAAGEYQGEGRGVRKQHPELFI